MGMNKELEDLKKSLSQIKRDFFRQKISSEEFQKQKRKFCSCKLWRAW